MTDIDSINGVSDGSTRHYTPTTEEVRDRSIWLSEKAFDRWLTEVEQKAWNRGYLAGYSKGQLDD